ncbi:MULTISPECIES: ATP-binding protein [Synechococcus]|jgi:serine/threonine-protein kinase RsbW|uniref:ATP-binding protein n=2 Tax=Synechococcus TaxID=1129 RepID=UPI0009CE7122|nr:MULTISPECIES: ATP-binding protein [Synechococcus]OON13248.1 MAG: anti-sigma regulatory factor [Synechococcus lacustris str. Tous]MCP9793756.1 ATP-binding protein [Synechococcus lacustris L1F-Slac]MCP9810599.1 ATP-binding protein [Synechococcus lacustris Maggiore-St4-Slac]MCP9812770.1 ATP-binding protein [Synechococcus lacustris L1E-Slac]MCP9924105.1 ATP-binding protein [Synechococcus lacustris C3-12m-Tous]
MNQAQTSCQRWRWCEFSTTSTLALQPLLELLLEPVPEADKDLIQLGLQEALVNAVRHGNGGDPLKILRVRRIMMPNWFVWQVQDQGCGLPQQLRCAHLPHCLDALSGRGLYLMHQCFDDVRWSPRGNRVQMAKRR